MMTTIVEAAFRSLLMGVCVWGSIRLLRVQTVLAQKVAWVLVLVAAVMMPLVMRAPFLALDKALTIPVGGLRSRLANRFFAPDRRINNPKPVQVAVTSSQAQAVNRPISRQVLSAAKPSAAHRLITESTVVTSSGPNLEPGRESGAEPGLRTMATQRLATLVPESTAEAVIASVPKPLAHTTLQAMTLKAPFWSWARVASGLVILYLGVAGMLLLRTSIGLVMAFRLWRRATPVTLEQEQEQEQPSILGHSILSIRASRETLTPVTVASTVILPADYAEWDEAKLRIVLAHEQSHVHQRDFYLQLAAALYAAIFWFSPLGWWLQRKLSDLGEALSDRAGLAQAPDVASYAQILLEFAAMPRKHPWSNPIAGVAMARSSNLSGRIERILNDRRFRLAFLGGRRHALLAVVLVPAVLVSTVAFVHIGPAGRAVRAAQATPSDKTVSLAQAEAPAPLPTPIPVPAIAPVEAIEPPDATALKEPETPEAPMAPQSPATPASPVAPVPPVPPAGPALHRDFAAGFSQSSEDSESWNDRTGIDSFAIFNGKNSTVTMSGRHGREMELAKKKYGTNFIWFERNGKSYVITDPSVLERSQDLFKGSEPLNRMQAELDRKQELLDKEMASAAAEQATVKLDSPEFKEEMKKLEVELSRLETIRVKELSEKITQESLSEIQNRVGEIQEHLGELQGRIGERQGEIGEKQGEIGERMGKLGEEMGRIGEQQGKIAEEATHKMKSVIDQAIKDGKAKPAE